MYQVNIWIRASTSNYWAKLEFQDKSGTLHQREIGEDRKSTINSNLLEALLKAVSILNRTCMLDIYTDSDYIKSAFRRGWLKDWESNGWKTAKGTEVKNWYQWQQLSKVISGHSVRFVDER